MTDTIVRKLLVKYEGLVASTCFELVFTKKHLEGA